MTYRKNTVISSRFFLFFACFLCFFSCKETPVVEPSIIQPPVIKEPAFSIKSIVIMQAELVNTRLKVKLYIENPNPFPVTLSSFTYELYGEGRFWADGTEKNVLVVPALGAAEKELFLVMNFIDMRRDIFDKVVAMDLIEYRFTGTVEINAEDMPMLFKNFNLKGKSEVTQ